MSASASEQPVTEELAGWLCATAYHDLPSPVRAKALDVLSDSVGGMIACSELPEVRMIVELGLQLGGQPQCTIIGRAERAPVVNAAMANGGMAHGAEVDPVHLSSSGGHVAAAVVPTALAVGELVDATGKDLLRAVTLGYEVGGRLMTLLYRERDYITRRFYHTAVAGSLSSAATAALLLGLQRQPLQVALGLAAYQAAGPDNMTRDPGHMGKTFQVAAANRNGVTAALLAGRGAFVPLDVLDGPAGFFDAFLGAPELASEMLNGLGEKYVITEVMHKRYPVGSPNQAYLQGLFRIFQQNRLQPEDIREIEVQIPTRSVHRIPTTRHASISGEVVCAIAATRGKLDFYELHDPAAQNDPRVQSMRNRIRFLGREDWKDLAHGRHAIVTVATTAGRFFREEVWFEPMGREELEEKFDALVAPRWGEEKSRRVKGILQGIDDLSTLGALMEQLGA